MDVSSFDKSSNINTPERHPIQAYSQDCTEEDNRTTRDYQIGPVCALLPQQCKEEEIPTDISTGHNNVDPHLIKRSESDSERSVTDHQDLHEEISHPDTWTDKSSNINIPERHPIRAYSQDCTEEDNRITQDYQMETCKEEEIPTDISTDESKNRNTPEGRPIHPYPQCSTEEEIRITQDYQMEPENVIFHQKLKEEEIPIEICTDSEFVLNNNFAPNDEEPKLVGESSSQETRRNWDSMLNMDVTLNEESNITDSEIEPTGSECFNTLNTKNTKRKKKYQGPLLVDTRKFTQE
ncbi:uncharacterized protein WCC33_000091 [Rhinophrynus dorsalis]